MKKNFNEVGIPLNRNDAKLILGGVAPVSCSTDGCYLYITQSDGTYLKEEGVCKSYNWQSLGVPNTCYCQTASFISPPPLSSNGGVSRCTL